MMYTATSTFIQPDTTEDNTPDHIVDAFTFEEAIGATLHVVEQDLRDNGFDDDVVAEELGLCYLDICRTGTHLNSQSEMQYSISAWSKKKKKFGQ